MKLHSLLFLRVLSSFSFSQAGWIYNYTVELLDAVGNEINANHINTGKVKIYLLHDGTHLNENGKFDSKKNAFEVSGHTNATSGRLIIIFRKGYHGH